MHVHNHSYQLGTWRRSRQRSDDAGRVHEEDCRFTTLDEANQTVDLGYDMQVRTHSRSWAMWFHCIYSTRPITSDGSLRHSVSQEMISRSRQMLSDYYFTCMYGQILLAHFIWLTCFKTIYPKLPKMPNEWLLRQSSPIQQLHACRLIWSLLPRSKLL